MEPPSESRIDDLNTATPNLAEKPTLANGLNKWIKWLDDLNTATPNLPDKPTLGNGPNWYWHLVVKMCSNLADITLDLLAEWQLPPVLTSRGHEWQFHITSDI